MLEKGSGFTASSVGPSMFFLLMPGIVASCLLPGYSYWAVMHFLAFVFFLFPMRAWLGSRLEIAGPRLWQGLICKIVAHGSCLLLGGRLD